MIILIDNGIKMNLLATQYTLSNKSFDIYLAGCNRTPHCKGCCNPESWNFNQGELLNNEKLNEIINKIKLFDNIINKISILGGEPLDQINLINLLEKLYVIRPIWLFTSYELNEIPENIKGYCDYIKCGKYIDELKTENNIQYDIKLATSNQRIYKKGEQY